MALYGLFRSARQVVVFVMPLVHDIEVPGAGMNIAAHGELGVE